MKPRNYRYAEGAAAANRSLDRIPDDRVLSILTHENQHLRALVDGKGRITVDRDLRAELEQQNQRNATLQKQLQNVRADRDRRADHQAGLEAAIGDLGRRIADQESSLHHQLAEFVARLDEVERRDETDARLVEEQAAVDELRAEKARLRSRVEELVVERQELQKRLDSGAEAERDLRVLLSAVASKRWAPLLRRSERFQELKARWLS